MRKRARLRVGSRAHAECGRVRRSSSLCMCCFTMRCLASSVRVHEALVELSHLRNDRADLVFLWKQQVGAIPAQLWQGWAQVPVQSRCRCGSKHSMVSLERAAVAADCVQQARHRLRRCIFHIVRCTLYPLCIGRRMLCTGCRVVALHTWHAACYPSHAACARSRLRRCPRGRACGKIVVRKCHVPSAWPKPLRVPLHTDGAALSVPA
jgi:hypothetical protein